VILQGNFGFFRGSGKAITPKTIYFSPIFIYTKSQGSVGLVATSLAIGAWGRGALRTRSGVKM